MSPRRAQPILWPSLPVLLLASLALAQTAPKFDLTIDNIMRGPGLIGYEPESVRWSGDDQRIYFRWKQYTDPILAPRDTWVVNRDGTNLHKLTDEQAHLAPPASADYTRDRKRAVYTVDGDVYLYDFSTDKARRLTATEDTESHPRFTQDEKRVAFVRANNLFVLSLDTASIDQLTNITTTPEPKKSSTDEQDFLKKQERDLLGIVSDRAKIREEEEARKKKENPRKPFELQPGQTLAELDLCPDETCVVAVIGEGAKDSKRDIIPNYITESAFTEEIPGRNNVGDNQDRQRLAILNVSTGEVRWVDPGAKDSEGKPRDVEMRAPVWNEQGTKAVFLERAMDNKDRWVAALDTSTGEARRLFAEHDDAWIESPGDEVLGWLKKSDEVYFVSERDGWAHLYAVPYGGGEPRQLTSGKFEVTGVDLSNDGSRFYLTTSEVSVYERQFYSMPVEGGPRQRLTRDAGNHNVTLSPDQAWIADIYSYTNKPPELFSFPNGGSEPARKLTNSPAPDFWAYPWLDVPIVEIPARDGAKLPARIYKPANYRRGGPAVIFVHGAGYLQNVHRWWSSYSPNFMFHHFLMEHGYLVLDVDYRASSGYGRDWRTAIYRHMGGKDLDDQVDAAKWLASAQGVDPKRIGIYGGSYGGFITLMAMFTTPGVFASGAALRPVTDWSHYNHGYTSNILNTPQKDPEAYRQSSPIFFADGLQGSLLICHGMVDTNVLFQDTVRLTQKLIELRKPNWSVAFYPVENHGFIEPTSWADEYKRIYDLFEKTLK